MEYEFGTYLKRQREAKGLSLSDLSRTTKVKEGLLKALEASQLDALPAAVFVRGWVTAYARAVGSDEGEALSRFRNWVDLARPDPPPVPMHEAIPDSAPPLISRMEPEDEWGLDKRRVGVVMVVLLMLVVATLTLSLLLRAGPHAGTGLS